MINIILANASVITGNRGCLALCYSSMLLIDNVLSESGLQYNLFLTHSFQKDGDYSINVAGKQIKYTAITLPTLSINGIIKSIIRFPQTLRNIKHFRDSCWVFDIGQGDSFADIYGTDRFNWIDNIHKLARLFCKPYILLPQTIGPFNNKSNLKKAIVSLNNSALVMVRDQQSLCYVNSISSNRKVKDYIDVAFFLPFEKMVFNQQYIHVGLNVSALIWNGGYTNNNQFELRDDYKYTIRLIIDFFLSLDGVKLHLVSHVVNSERIVENDYAVCYDLWKEYHNENIILAPFALDPMEVKSYISGLDFFIGARMHATIGAFSAGVPVVPMAYSRKFNGLFEKTLNYPYMIDMKTMTGNEIVDFIKRTYKERIEIKTIISSRLNGVVKEQKELLYNDINDIIIS